MGAQNRRLETIWSVAQIEERRLEIQSDLDASKSIEERRQLGQFATPPALAQEVVSYALSLLPDPNNIRFLEPAIGTGAFFSALQSITGGSGIKSAVGYEIDPLYATASQCLWHDSIVLRTEDFTKAKVENESISLLISNPPYVRHHLICADEKSRLARQVFSGTGHRISGLAGLYCYFVLQAHKWLAPDAISGWLIPSEFMDVNYGGELKKYLLEDVQLLRIHRYNPQTVLFDDALVSSCVVWFRKRAMAEDYEIEFSYGGSHTAPDSTRRISKSTLLTEKKWTRFPCKQQRDSNEKQDKLKDFFSIKRGIATGDNSFFILTKRQIDSLSLELDYFKPILPSPRYLRSDHIAADQFGYPLMDEQYFVLDCTLSEDEIAKEHPELWNYLLTGQDSVAHKYLCSSRKKWYFQETRQSAPFLCTYMGRNVQQSNSPFHFILNQSDAVATNSYLMMYPTDEVLTAIKASPKLLTKIWEYLNSISADTLESEGRVYGGGLKKIEPKELLEVPCPELSRIIWGRNRKASPEQLSLWNYNAV